MTAKPKVPSSCESNKSQKSRKYQRHGTEAFQEILDRKSKKVPDGSSVQDLKDTKTTGEYPRSQF